MCDLWKLIRRRRAQRPIEIVLKIEGELTGDQVRRLTAAIREGVGRRR